MDIALGHFSRSMYLNFTLETHLHQNNVLTKIRWRKQSKMAHTLLYPLTATIILAVAIQSKMEHTLHYPPYISSREKPTRDFFASHHLIISSLNFFTNQLEEKCSLNILLFSLFHMHQKVAIKNNINRAPQNRTDATQRDENPTRPKLP